MGLAAEVTDPGENHSGIPKSEGSPTPLGSMSFVKIYPGGMFHHKDKEVKHNGILYNNNNHSNNNGRFCYS